MTICGVFQKFNSTGFLIRDRHDVDGFIYCFWLLTILLNQKLKNVKYSFWLQIRIKNAIQQVFLRRDRYIVDGLINPKSEKRKIPFLGTKRGQNFNYVGNFFELTIKN